jgi:hypothetical protein
VFFGIPRTAKCGGAKIYHSVFFSLIIMIYFFLKVRPVSGVVGKFKCLLKKHGLSAHAVGI